LDLPENLVVEIEGRLRSRVCFFCNNTNLPKNQRMTEHRT
jgi:hypothetical protein